MNGTLYGTTVDGGGLGDGIVFSINAADNEKVLHRFRGGTDGAYPQADLIDVDGTLYGMTTFGGDSGLCSGLGCGTVFSLSTAGAEKVLYRFAGGCNGCDDGALPYGDLIDVNGTLYGTTCGGGDGFGTVFSVSTAGKEKVLYRFRTNSSSNDGLCPYAGLTNVNGTLYGTTYSGSGGYGHGTVFSVSTAGKEKVLYSFRGGSDGEFPYAGLTNVDGILYGTTYGGGSTGYYTGCQYGCGTVYSVSLSGAENVLYRFSGGSDGANPRGGLVEAGGTLYGTTEFGGGGNCQSKFYMSGCGTIYAVSTAGSESILHSFSGGTDGSNPYAGLIDASGTLYGTTASGGANGRGAACYLRILADGCGTVFALTP